MALILVFVAMGCTDQETEMPVAVFDGSHQEIFSPYSNEPMGYSELFMRLEKSDYRVLINEENITEEILGRTDLYIIAGPVGEFSKEDAILLKDYVNNGGDVLILVHISPSVATVLNEFDISISRHVVAESENIIDYPQNFHLVDITDDPLTKEVTQLAAYGSWALRTGADPDCLAWASSSAWLDKNRDMMLDPDERQDKYCIIIKKEPLMGKILVIGDDAPFINAYIDESDNNVLLENTISWFLE